MRLLISAILAIVFVRPAFADPPPCKRWRNQLTVCEALGVAEGCSPQGIQHEQVNAQLFASSATKACKQLVTKRHALTPLYNYTPGEKVLACVWGTAAGDNKCYEIFQILGTGPSKDIADCIYDANNDGYLTYQDRSLGGLPTVSWTPTTPESHCFCTAKGPYTDLPWAHESEGPWAIFWAWAKHSFPKGLKTAVLAENYKRNGNTYRTDALRKTTNTPFDPEPNLQKTDYLADNAAEIDHIIPRVDSQGCLCGDVTINNAAVISRELNGSMLNVSPKYDQNRWKMYEKYVTCPSPSNWQSSSRVFAAPASLPLESLQTDESTFDLEVDHEKPPEIGKAYSADAPDTSTETTGCSSSAGGFGGLAVVLGFLGLRRRRYSVMKK